MSFLETGNLNEDDFPLFAEFRRNHGYIPDFYRAQGLRPGFIKAEAHLFAAVMSDGALTRKQKEYIAVAVSGENLSTYCATTHSAALRTLGVTDSELDQLGVDHHYAGIPEADKVLLDFAVKLTRTPGKITAQDVEDLRTHGFSDAQILEGVAVASLMNFANRISSGVGAVPDRSQ